MAMQGRSFKPGFWVLTGIGIGVAFVPVFGGALSHFVDRVKHGAQAKDELGYRTKFYRNQIAKQLGISPQRVTTQDFKLAAQVNPMLGKAYNEVVRDKDKANRESMFINAGVTAASAVGAGALVKGVADVGMGAKVLSGAAEMAAVTAGSAAGGAVAGLFHKEQVSAHDIAFAMKADLEAARAKGQDTTATVKPQSVFALRVAQDEALADDIKKRYGTAFHKMSGAQQLQVMGAFPALANAATSEARALGMGVVQPETLMASPPNLDSIAAKYAAAPKSSFTQRVNDERAAAAMAASTAPAV